MSDDDDQDEQPKRANEKSRDLHPQAEHLNVHADRLKRAVSETYAAAEVIEVEAEQMQARHVAVGAGDNKPAKPGAVMMEEVPRVKR